MSSGDEWGKNMKTLIGQYQSKVGNKGRVAFPKKFRSLLGDKIIITRGYEGCLIAVSQKDWQTLSSRTENKPFTLGPARDTARFLLGNAAEIELDDQGRFVIPGHLREYSNAREEVVFLGLSHYVEIWATEKWHDYQRFLAKNIDHISERLEQINNQKE